MRIKNLVEMIKHNGLLASMAQLEKLYQVAIENEQKLSEFEARCAALAAENAGLKAAIETHKHGFVRCNCCGDELMCHTDDVCRALDDTPATDAFLAEVRAQGVEMLNTQFKKCTGMLYADSVVSTAEHFAAQLRKGVQS
ncbi:hypothetical protein [Enterobacter sp. KB-280D8]|uniref:hypothetical protein n=1 Tax=Enterobacter sp. KB-280D8 TaxID=3242495 RepID=UPI00209F8463|nr:hypothetical protein [Enterobacter bugandensis]